MASKTLNTLTVKHTAIMGAVTKSLADGRMKAFMTDATDETRDAIVDVVRSNLTRLMNGKGLPKSKKVAKTEKASKATKKTTKVAKTEKVERSGNKSIRKIERLIGDLNEKVIRLRNKTDDADRIKKSVRNALNKAGLETKSVNRVGSAVVIHAGNKFKVQFKNKGIVITDMAA